MLKNNSEKELRKMVLIGNVAKAELFQRERKFAGAVKVSILPSDLNARYRLEYDGETFFATRSRNGLGTFNVYYKPETGRRIRVEGDFHGNLWSSVRKTIRELVDSGRCYEIGRVAGF